MQPEPATNEPTTIHWATTTKVLVAALVIILLGFAVYLFRVVFVPLIIGGILAYILYPVVGWINRKIRIPHGLATVLVYLLLLVIVIPLPASLIPWGVRQLTVLQYEFLDFVEYLNQSSADTVQVLGFDFVVGDIVDEVTGQLVDAIRSVAPASIEIVFGAAETLLLVIFTFLIAFYFTRDSKKAIDWFSGLAPPVYQEDVELLRREIGAIWSAFLRGQFILSIIVALLLTVISAVIGLPQPILMGVLGGLLEFLPSIGHAIWLVIASVLALLEGSTWLPVSNFVFFLIIVGIHTAYTQFDLNILIPRIIGRQVHLHPMVVIIGIIIGAQVGGILGVALAAPTIASLRIIGRYIYARLFDLDPFPMIGPPTTPKEQRERQAAEIESQPLLSIPSPRQTVKAVQRRVRRPPRGRDGGPDSS
nr:AI-2E family transporter [Anaerolineae bacterium]